eukprot:scaffold233175_cov37-Tisochrysis_lutea.AAC.2
MLYVYMGCCLLGLGWYAEAEEKAQQGPACPLQNRLLFHISHRINDETKLMSHHQQLADTTLDQLSLASIHYLRNHFQVSDDVGWSGAEQIHIMNPYGPAQGLLSPQHLRLWSKLAICIPCNLPQEATDIYKRLLLENRDYAALNVYVALCYYKLDYYDVSLEILAAYLQASGALDIPPDCACSRLFGATRGAPLSCQAFPDSAIALNLKACNQFRLYDGKAALDELAPLTREATSIDKIDSKLVRHNMVVFQNGERALQVSTGSPTGRQVASNQPLCGLVKESLAARTS